MSKTFQFGNGEWAVGKETALAYNDENSNFKPLSFTFDRGSIGTVVNKQGLIETVGIDEPRIDFLNNTKGHLLLEPERRNIVTDSEALTYFSSQKDSTTLSVSITNPKGESGAIKYIPDSGTGGNRSISKNLTGLSGLHTQSVFAKKDELRYLFLRLRNAPTRMAVFDLQDGVISDFNINVPKIENYGNGWYRCSATFDPSSSDTAGQLVFSFSADNTGSLTGEFDGDGTSGLFLWGAQIEAGSYATSYIPTQGEINGVTRSGELDFEREDMVDLNLYSSEMTWFYDINLFYREAGTTVAPRLINTSNGQVFIGVNTPQSTNTDLRIRHKNGTTALNTSAVTFTNGGRFKVAVKITGTTGTAYINGTNVGTFTTLAASNYDKYENTQNNSNNINDMRFYNTALSDSELATLTTL
jgi:hypothetical protein